MKDIYFYPAVFTEEGDALVITFPDFPDNELTVESPLKLAGLEIGQELFIREDNGEKFPEPTPISKISYDKDTQYVSIIKVDMADIRKRTTIKKLI